MSRRRFVVPLCVAVLASQAACGPIGITTRVAPPPHVAVATVPSFGTIAVVPAGYPPRADFPQFAATGTGGALEGAAGGLGLWGLFVLLSGCLNPITAPSCPALLPAVAGGALVGVAASADVAAGSAPGVDPAQAQSTVLSAFREARLQEVLRDKLLRYGATVTRQTLRSSATPGPESPDQQLPQGALREEGIDTALEIGVLKIGLDRSGASFSPQSNLYATARARLVRLSDGKVQHDAPYEAMSLPLTAEQWSQGNAHAFRKHMQLVLQDLAEQIVDHLFLEYQPPMPRYSGFAGRCQEAPLRPEYPVPVRSPCISCVRGIFSNFFAHVDTVRPVLRWESFPTPGDLDADAKKRELLNIVNVRYELRILAGERYGPGPVKGGGLWMPGEILYTRDTASPSHQVEVPLRTCTSYFLTYRARFELNGQPRATRWAGTYNAGPTNCIMTTEPEKQYPSRHYYPFRTPCTEVDRQ